MSLLANSNAIESGGYPIQRSLRFRSSASAYLNRTPSVTGNQKTWVWSGWIKRGALGAYSTLISAGSAAANADGFRFTNTDTLEFFTQNGTGCNLITTQVFRDPSAGYHIVLAYDSTQATAANRVKLYVNGSQVTSFSTATYPALNANSTINLSGIVHAQAVNYNSAYSLYLDGYLAEVNFIDGQALTPSSFGQTDAVTGVWTPKKYTGTYGTNGFYLPFSDNTSATTLAYDKSGNGNNWTANNISTTAGATYDSMTDVPTLTSTTAANYCVLNPLDTGGTAPSSANLELIAGAAERGVRSTFAIPTTGLYYAEAVVGTNQSGATDIAFGFVARTTNLSANPSGISNGWLCYATGTTNITRNGTSTLAGAGTALVSGDVLQLAIDLANNKGWLGKNNTWFNGTTGTDGNPSTGANPTFTFSSPPELFVLAHCYSSTINVNFGQRPFSYTPPTGFNALNTFNLPDPTIKKPNQYMDATTYTGTGSALSVTNAAGFQPDFVWVKGRSGATDHALYDAVRGVQKQLESNTTTAETTETTGLTTFNSNGFSVGALAQMNTNAATYVGWQWKESATAGFDIVTYTGDGTQPRQINHSLGVAPKFIITKSRSAGGYDWNCWFTGFSDNQYIALNSTAAKGTDANTFPSAAGMTSTYFTIGSGAWINGNGTTYVAYLFAEIAGFSKFGSYTGNGSTDGPFVYCGFRPKYVMVKRTDTTGGWEVMDAARNTSNQVNYSLSPNFSDAEYSIYAYEDFVSNGFKLRTTDPYWNASGGTYIFCAFAENPFKYSNAR